MCDYCNGNKKIDQGEYPWGETIWVPCPECVEKTPTSDGPVERLVVCPRPRTGSCVDSPDGKTCCCCGCVEMVSLADAAAAVISVAKTGSQEDLLSAIELMGEALQVVEGV